DAEGPAAHDTRIGTSCRQSSSLKFFEKVSPEVLPEESAGAAVAAPRDGLRERKNVDPKSSDDEQRAAARARKVMLMFPSADIDHVARVSNAPIDIVRQVRRDMDGAAS